MEQFVVWELRGVRYLGLRFEAAWLETIKRLPQRLSQVRTS